MNEYQELGYETRLDYLNALAEDTGVPREIVYSIAQVYGPSEDFDGLVTAVEDYAESQYQ